MRNFFFRILIWIVLFGLVFLAGDRYGAPGWMSRTIAPAFDFVERQVGNLLDRSPEVGDQASDDLTEEEDTEEPPQETVAEAPPAPAPAPSTPATGGIPANASLRINEAGLDIIKKSEGLRLEAYSSGGRQYIGYGHQMKAGEPSKITEAQATALLRQDVKVAEDGVRKRLTRPANENEFSAMVSLAYNLGTGAFGRSLVPQYFNEGRKQAAADAFRNHNKAGGKVISHLTSRREEERELFLTPA